MKSNRIYLACVPMLLGLWTAAAFAQTFTRIDTSIITRDGGHSQGASWGDYDNDGDEDLFISNGFNPRLNINHKNFLYRNEGAGRFTKISAGDLVTEVSTAGGSGASWGDYDNDGDLDLFFPAFAADSRWYRNEGNGILSKIPPGVNVNDGPNHSGGAWVDYDNDGDLDLFVISSGSYDGILQANRLYRNEGNGDFVKITQGLFVTEAMFSYSGNWADYDNDGDMDLFVANSTSQGNRLYFNNGDGRLGLVSSSVVGSYIGGSASASWGDYDNDGYLDLFVTSYNGPNALYHNIGNGDFESVTTGIVVTERRPNVGSSWGDFENDGDLDLIVATDSPMGNFLYFNDGHGNFTKITGESFTNDKSIGLSVCDYDQDGDLDILAVNGGFGEPLENYLYSNNGNGNNWLNLKCVGTTSNRSGIGARVRAKAFIRGAAVWQMREIAQQSGFGGHNSLRVHFGFGDATKIDSLVIRWPSKTTEVYTNVVVNQFMTAIEGRSLTSVGERQEEQPASFSLSQNYPNPFNPETTIEYQLPRAGQVKVVIYNLAGQLVRTLLDAQHAAGKFQTHWDGKDELGNQVASGVYLYQLQAGSFQATQKMILMR